MEDIPHARPLKGSADDGKRNEVYGMEMDVLVRATCCIRGGGLGEGGCLIPGDRRESDFSEPSKQCSRCSLSTILTKIQKNGFSRLS